MKIVYFLAITFFVFDKAHTTELIEPIYDEDGKIFNYREVSRYAVCAFNRIQNDYSFRFKAAQQIIETSKNYEDECARFKLLNPMILSDHNEGSLLAIEEVKVYMKTSKRYWSNYLEFLHRFPGFDLNDKESATKNIHKLMDTIDLIGGDREITGKPRETLISALDFIQYCVKNKESQKKAEESIDTLEYRNNFRLDLAKVLARADEIKERIQ